MTQKMMNWMAAGVLGLAGVFICLLVFWLTWPYQPVVFELDKNTVLNPRKQVQPGDILYLESKFTKTTNLPARVSRSLRNGVIYNLGDIIYQRQAGKYHIVNATTVIPKEMPEGQYVLELVYSYEVNPIRTISVWTRTEIFAVTKDAPWVVTPPKLPQ